MPAKTTKKTTAKKPVAKKAVAPVAAKKPAVKKAPAKKAAPVAVVAPVVETHPCGCDHKCPCGGKCKKCGFFKKLVLFLIIFALGFAAAKMCCMKPGKMMPKPEFENGCLVVKCPKLAEMAPKMDTDANGCISMEEFKKFHKPAGRKMRGPRHERHAAPKPAPQAE